MGEKLIKKSRRASSIPTCPTLSRWKGDLVGCGSTDVIWDEGDKVYDCFNCGLFFNREQSLLNWKTRQREMQ